MTNISLTIKTATPFIFTRKKDLNRMDTVFVNQLMLKNAKIKHFKGQLHCTDRTEDFSVISP